MAPQPLDTDVLIIGAGMSGLGLAVQLLRNHKTDNFELIEKTEDVGGTWLVNTYPGCGCDVASHFYSYSFELNPDWSRKFSMQSEIQAYFRGVAEKYGIDHRTRFGKMVETARWKEEGQFWEVVVKDVKTGEKVVKRSRVLVSAVGNLSVPRPCEIPGNEEFQGRLFHSAQWDNSFDWENKDVVVLGNGCSATQFVPILAQTGKQVTQFSRQAQFLAERTNPTYSSTFKAVMRYVPLAQRLYRFKLYADMERDFAGFDIESGKPIRQALAQENEAYVKAKAPERYWDALIPKHEIGCKRKVLDTDYLASLHKPNMELIHDDKVERITPTGVVTSSGREIHADAIVLATGFEVHRMLTPMEIVGQNGTTINEYWDNAHEGAAQAYLGTCMPGFPNFFTLMGPNTVTGHLSVIYTVECQIGFLIRLIDPILKSLRAERSTKLLPSLAPPATAVDVKAIAAKKDSESMQTKLRKLVWASGCTSWALDPKTGKNIAMYPDWQFWFWWRSIFIPGQDFEYKDGGSGKVRSLAVGGWKNLRDYFVASVVTGATVAWMLNLRRNGRLEGVEGAVRRVLRQGLEQGRGLLRA